MEFDLGGVVLAVVMGVLAAAAVCVAVVTRWALRLQRRYEAREAALLRMCRDLERVARVQVMRDRVVDLAAQRVRPTVVVVENPGGAGWVVFPN